MGAAVLMGSHRETGFFRQRTEVQELYCAAGFSRSGIPAEGTSAEQTTKRLRIATVPFFSQILADQIEHGGESTEAVVFFNMEL